MTKAYDEIASQLVDHSQALVIWILQYVKRNNLPLTDEKDYPAFEFHLRRLGALLQSIAYPLPLNPIRSEMLTATSSFKEMNKKPNEMLQQELQGLPNVDVTLPHVTMFIRMCYYR